MEDYSGYPGGPKLMTGIFKSRGPFLVVVRRRREEVSGRCNNSSFEDGGRGSWGRDCEQPAEPEKVTGTNSPLEPLNRDFDSSPVISMAGWQASGL